MEVKDILSSLAELEANLKSIESAKKQVEATIASCTQIGQTAGQYSAALGGIATTVSDIVTLLNAKKEFIESEAKEILKSFKTQCEATVESEKTAIQGISTSFSTSCTSVVDAVRAELKKQSDSFESTISAKSIALNTSISNLNAEIAKLESLYTLLKTTLHDLTTLSGDVMKLREELSESQTKQDQDLASIKKQIENLISDVKTQFTSLQKELKDSQKDQDAELKRISNTLVNSAKQADENSKSISRDIVALQEATKMNKTLIIICLVSIIIAIISIFAKS